MVTQESVHPASCSSFTGKVEASHHILCSKLFGQSLEGLVGLLLAQQIDAGIPQFVVEVGLCHGSEVVTLTGCVKEDIASNDNGGVVDPTDMKVDELNVKVTADVPTAVLSSFDAKSMGGALVRRLPKTTSSLDAGTKMILIKGEDILNRPLTEWLEAAKIYLTGGYIAIEKPHNAHLVHLMEQLSARFEQATYDILTKDDGSGVVVNIVPPNTLTSGNTINADAAKMKTRIANINALASNRSGVGEGDAVETLCLPRAELRCALYRDASLGQDAEGR